MPSLPLDLERMIFELAALEDTDHDNRVQITLVAKRVYEWIRPILYRIAIARISSNALIIHDWRNVQRTNVGPFVRHLLTLLGEESPVLELLSIFRNVENLAIWSYGPISSVIMNGINDLPLHTFSADLSEINLDEAVKNCRAIRNLTRLEILDLKLTEDCKALVEFPKLTHLSFYHINVKGEVILNLLESCPSLRVLLVECLMEVAIPIKSGDPRFLVFQDEFGVGDAMILEWERSANGEGLWELAGVIVAARKGNLFNDNTSFTFSRLTWMNGLNDVGVRWYEKWSRDNGKGRIDLI